ncbi:MAG: prephenate dehydratase [Pseudomonadota bacterium]
MSTISDRLTTLRQQVDLLDDEIGQLLERRAQAAKQIGEYKRSQGEDAVYYKPEREIEILRDKLKKYSGLIHAEDLASIYRAIFRACLNLQKPIQVGYLGPQGTFSQAALIQHFGQAVRQMACESIEDIFKQIESNKIDYGVVPIENSTTGMINLTLDRLLVSPLQIIGEIKLRIQQNLLSLSTEIKNLKTIYSHQQSLWQCQNWLKQHLPQAKQIAVASNAKAAELAKQDATSAAIAGELAAKAYQLNLLASNIEDKSQNTTRFLILGQQSVAATGNDKTSLIITTPHDPGALLKIMAPLAKHQVNITAIASRPYQLENWTYLFFIDLEGHQTDKSLALALAEIKQNPIMFKILGSYPQAVEI